MRGLAAFAVFASHTLPRALPVHGLIFSPLGLMWGGQAAVILFFVLSGFVLSLPQAGETKSDGFARFYGKFALLRLFRIYPAYWFALLFAIAMATTLHGGWPGFSRERLARNILLAAGFGGPAINGTSWTLSIELRLSLLVPFVVLLFRRWGDWRRTLLWVLASLGLALAVQVFHYLPMFVLGVALARHWAAASAWARAMPRFAFRALLVAALLLYGNLYIFPAAGLLVASDYVSALGSGLLILLTVRPSLFAGVLLSRSAQFLGRISYSFYLLHLPIVAFLFARLEPTMHEPILTGLLALVASSVAADLSYRAFERPFITLSHRLVRNR